MQTNALGGRLYYSNNRVGGLQKARNEQMQPAVTKHVPPHKAEHEHIYRKCPISAEWPSDDRI
jgi:hypothetical protein